MKKRMRDENLLKLSELADRSVTDISVANVLLCYMLKWVDDPLEEELLYEIAVSGGIINYFTYNEALAALQSNGSVSVTENEEGEKFYQVTPKGAILAHKLRAIAAKSYRDHIILAAKRALDRHRHEEDVKIGYEDTPGGCHLRVTIFDHDVTLLDLTLFTPDQKQAKLLGDRILANPSTFYNNVLLAAMKNEEEPLDLSDN